MNPDNYLFNKKKPNLGLAYFKICLSVLAVFLCHTGRAQQNLPELVSDDAVNPKELTEYNGKVFFSADDANGKNWLWSTDGTTTEIRSYSAPAGFPGTQPRSLFVFNNQLILSSVLKEGNSYNRELFEFDGTGPILIKNIQPGGESNPKGFTEFDGNLCFSADDGNNGDELWITDGTGNGTQLLKDINPGSANSYPIIYNGGIEYDGKMIFNAGDATHGNELWTTDGTNSGTNLLKDINSGASSSVPFDFKTFDNKVYFFATDDAHGNELWVTDGTTAGTMMLKDIHPGSGDSYPAQLTQYNGKLYFSADDGAHGKELWVTDGTENGTHLFKDINSGSVRSNPYDFTVYEGKLYFGAYDGNSYGLMATDGTVANTVKVKAFSSLPSNIFTYDNRLYFVAEDASNGHQLWVSDGTTSGTEVVMPAIAPNSDPISETNFEQTVVGGTLYYNADYDGSGEKLYKLTTNNLGVEEKIKSEFTVYPNPVQDILHIETATESIQKIQLFSITGKHLQNWEGKTDINLSQFAPGSYFVKITAQDGKTVVKQVVKK